MYRQSLLKKSFISCFYDDICNRKLNDMKKETMYLDYVNNFLTIERFAEYYDISINEANNIINVSKFNQWLKQYNSKFEMTGDLSWFDSIMININENDFYQIGVNNENKFVFCIYRNDEFYTIEQTDNYLDLYRWQNTIEL